VRALIQGADARLADHLQQPLNCDVLHLIKAHQRPPRFPTDNLPLAALRRKQPGGGVQSTNNPPLQIAANMITKAMVRDGVLEGNKNAFTDTLAAMAASGGPDGGVMGLGSLKLTLVGFGS
jgi:hypothetical protein